MSLTTRFMILFSVVLAFGAVLESRYASPGAKPDILVRSEGSVQAQAHATFAPLR
jgi:hypothetical protein